MRFMQVEVQQPQTLFAEPRQQTRHQEQDEHLGGSRLDDSCREKKQR